MLSVILISFPYPAEIMAPYWQNQSCDPFTPRSSACRLGNYVDYTVNVSSPSDVAAGLQFAQKYNIRVVIKNTGHELVAMSTSSEHLHTDLVQLSREVDWKRCAWAVDTQPKIYRFLELFKPRLRRASNQDRR